MANIQSQIKRNRQNLKRRERNKAVQSRVKTSLRRFRAALAEGTPEEAEQAFREASRELDKAVTKGVLHRNNAANKKSRMARKLQAS